MAKPTSILTFSMDELRPIINHARTSRNHRAAYADIGEQSPGPGLMLVKDDGIYLMSNGMPGFMRTDIKAHRVCYARGYDPTKDDDVWERSRAAVGGDDFAQLFDLEAFENAERTLSKEVKVLVHEDRFELVWTPQIAA